MLRTAIIVSLILAGLSCTRATDSAVVAAGKKPEASTTPWSLDPAQLPAGTQALGTVQLSRHFPLYDPFFRHRGKDARMSAWGIPVHGRTWWAVDTRYTFATEDDAARFLASQQAKLAEGHPLIEPSLRLACDPAARLFAGRIVHPGLGTPFLAFVIVGRHRHHVFKFLAAVELPADPATDPGEGGPSTTPPALRADFLTLAGLALKP
jgi:hypothetical protein